ncbi:MAG: flagellar motor switch protein FliN [Gammaproteobacteria bacterium]|nr:MAG: flagellar motor switch protein FliN [Pseudomonadota bacterium]MBC6944202.1 flagellar motor switch protein FliN [Gammaproteobacteria bacterium]MCE7895661.1 flagellar motor switch protein FliN [Gammaproteobacteria bacterium PRO8]MDL1879541.1 flagellar motor switch protein FliN [Gammaproteobacteria bacterium PRO2]MCQ3934175.1 flagellar motor switch protein FliN [Gammaproteobacteria bacterium]
MDEQKTTDSAAARSGKPDAGFRAASFQQVNESGGGSCDAHPSIDVILDVPVTLSLEVGRAQMSVGHLLRLSQGSVVELDRSAGEPLDVLVNGALVAHGEIVVVNDKFGIRLTDVVGPPARQPQP